MTCLRALAKLGPPRQALRCFSSRAAVASGHSRWAKIKHDKAKTDGAQSKDRSALSKELTQVSKLYGAESPQLRSVIAAAKRIGFPKQSIENAIARGQGLSASGAALISFSFELMLPASGVAALVECQTDNKSRSLQDLREAIKKLPVRETPTAYMFERRGKITFGAEQVPQYDELFEHAVEAGAVDVKSGEDDLPTIYTEPNEVTAVAGKLEKALGVKPSAELVWEAKDDVRVDKIDDESKEELQGLMAKLEDDPSVQEIHLNLA